MKVKMTEGLRDLGDILGPNYEQLYTQEEYFETNTFGELEANEESE